MLESEQGPIPGGFFHPRIPPGEISPPSGAMAHLVGERLPSTGVQVLKLNNDGLLWPEELWHGGDTSLLKCYNFYSPEGSSGSLTGQQKAPEAVASRAYNFTRVGSGGRI